MAESRTDQKRQARVSRRQHFISIQWAHIKQEGWEWCILSIDAEDRDANVLSSDPRLECKKLFKGEVEVLGSGWGP